MKKSVYLLLITLVFFVCCGNAGAKSDLNATNLKCEYQVNPLGIDILQPRLSWVLDSNKKNQMQSAYRIVVATSRKGLNKNIGDAWDSGKVGSDMNSNIEYAGVPLSSDTQYFWKVKVWDGDGVEGRWSKSAYWSMGLLKDSEKVAKWIGYDKGLDPAADPLNHHFGKSLWIWNTKEKKKADRPVKKRYFRKDITIAADRKIENANIAITAEHSFELIVNGKKVGAMERVAFPQRYDLSAFLKAGKNNIAVIGEDQPINDKFSGLIAAMLIEFDSGEPMVVKTDESWTVSDAPPSNWEKSGN